MKMFPFFLFLTAFIFPFKSVYSETNQDFYAKTKNSFLTSVKSILDTKDTDAVSIQLIAVSPGVTVSTAFGHIAIRVQFAKEYDDKDFYVDFGQYDESVYFLWSFLRGNARFHFAVVPMASAYETWDSTGRGFQTSEFKMSSEQKIKMLTEIKKLFENRDGYEYNNFKSNCVTFVRDLINDTYGIKLELPVSAKDNTWRKRVRKYSDKNAWLRIEEKLLFDHDPDKERKGSELIYLPFDLLIGVEDAKIVKPPKLLIPDRWQIEHRSDFLGVLAFVVFVFVAVSQIPYSLFQSYEKYGKWIFALLSGIGGAFALLVLTVTNFDFMDENIAVLVFNPVDFFLIKKNVSEHKHYKKFILARLFMILAAFLLRITVYRQDIDFILFFASIFFIMNAYSVFFNKSEPVHV